MTLRDPSSLSSSSSSSSSSVGADAFQALRGYLDELSHYNASALLKLINAAERQVHEGITHLQKRHEEEVARRDTPLEQK